MENNKIPLALNAGEGKEIKVGNSNLVFKLISEHTDNKLLITEYELLPGFPGPSAHKHKVFEHTWYLLKGVLSIQLETKETILSKRGFVFIPKKVIHAFSNKSDSIVRFLAIDMPGGFEKYYEDLQTAFGEGKTLDPETFRVIQLHYDTYPPDYLFE